MSRAQPSIRSFFQPKQPPSFVGPPAQAPPATGDGDGDGVRKKPALRAIQPAPTATLPPPMFAKATATHHPRARIEPVSAAHIPAMRRINSLLLQVNYADSFYHKVLDPAVAGLYSRVIMWQDMTETSAGPVAAVPQVVGGVVCRLDDSPFAAAGTLAIYIQSLALLSPYRSLGLAAAALESILAQARRDPRVATVYAHVWTENAEGLRWYEARGFVREGPAPVQGYYFKLRPDTAWVMRREVVTPPSQSSAALPASLPRPVATAAPPSMLSPAVAAAALPPPIVTMTGGVTAAAVNLPPFGGQAASSSVPSPSPSPAPSSSLSFQNARPETEWNDLPEDMMQASSSSRSASRSNLLSPDGVGSAPRSGASSRSSSTARKKRDRSYPAAAFGS